MPKFEITVTQNYINQDEESWIETVAGLDSLKLYIETVCCSVTASSWVFVIVPCRED